MKVAVGVLFDSDDNVLVACRLKGSHLAGYWEFPGGKVEAHETTAGALQREFEEELGIQIKPQQPLITIAHQYPEKTVLLDVWRVALESGEAFGKEGQEVKWLPKSQLCDYTFPEANQNIIKALQLPEQYLITPECGVDQTKFIDQIKQALQQGIGLIQLRSKNLSENDYISVAEKVSSLCLEYGAQLMLNSDCVAGEAIPGVGLHLTSSALGELKSRPVDEGVWCGASCHNEQELNQAIALDVDFVCLSPVLATLSHQDAEVLGWQKFAALCELSTVPVYALGGLSLKHSNQVVAAGGQGIAAIRAFWPCEY